MAKSNKRTRLLTSCWLALSTFATLTAACTSRTVAPKPRPEVVASTPPPDALHTSPTTAVTSARPNITFPIFSCPPTYAAWYCLNDATCFSVEIHNEILYNCECAIGYMGPRCEYKEIDGAYLPTRQRVMLEKASIVSGATLALLFMIICCMMLYIRHEKRMKMKLNESGEDVGDLAHINEGMDVVDGLTRVPVLRPFGAHHYPIMKLEDAFRRANERVPLHYGGNANL